MNPIKRHRLKIGLSQVDLAEVIGVHRRTIQSWEYGVRNALPKHVDKLALVFCTDVIKLARSIKRWRGNDSKH